MLSIRGIMTKILCRIKWSTIQVKYNHTFTSLYAYKPYMYLVLSESKQSFVQSNSMYMYFENLIQIMSGCRVRMISSIILNTNSKIVSICSEATLNTKLHWKFWRALNFTNRFNVGIKFIARQVNRSLPHTHIKDLCKPKDLCGLDNPNIDGITQNMKKHINIDF